jgi:3-oxoacyl-[acyl-carrier protein] reductase
MNELSGKVALITGAAKNIGRSIALSLAADGAAVGVNTRASRSEADQVANEIRGAGGKAEVFMADVADPAAVQAMVDGVINKFGRLDILVLNAAHRNEVPFLDMDFEEWRRVMSITLDSTFLCIKAALPHLIKAGGGDIITFGGAKALSSSANRVHVAAAKHGVVGLTRTLAKEVAQYGIRVNCVSPGPIATSRPAGRADHKTPTNGIPLGRLGGPDEIAAMVRFLCGPGGKFITGQTMHVNGGTQMTS